MNGSNLRTPSSLPSAGRMKKQKYRFVGNGRRRVFQFERLEQRQLLAADVFIQPAIHKVVDGDDTPAPFTRSVDSAAIVAPWQTVEFDPVTRTERVLTATKEDSKFLQSLEGFAQSQGFSGIMDLIGGPQKPPVEKTTGDKDSEEKDVDLGVERNWIIWGADGRTRVADTTAYPYSAVGKQWQTYGSSMFVCSGALVGPFHFLTAGHCVHDGTAWADSVLVSMGQDGMPLGGTRSDDQFFGEARWTTARTFTGWTSSGDWNWDLAVVTLDRNIGSHTGWLGYGYNDDNNFFNNSNARTSGYPGDLNNATVGLGQYTQTGNIRSQGITTHQLRTNTMDTWGGQSGSSVWYDGPHSYGVYSHSAWADAAQTIPLYNSWTRINSDKFTSIGDWKNADTSPTDRPDLVDYDQWFDTNFAGFSPSSVPIGQSINVTAFPRNNGTSAAGTFSVRFRLSTNQVYDVSDHLLGDVSLSSLNAFSWTTANLVANVPSIPTGQYYVVWSIDPFGSVSEFVENNNTGTTNTRVTITPPLLPDLRGWWTDVQSSNLSWGQSFQVRGQVRNDGNAAVNSPFYQDFFLSNDQVWGDADDILLGWHHHTAPVPNGSTGPEFFKSLTLPSSPPAGYLSTGAFYIGMKSDALNAIVESNESNNNPGSFNQTFDWDSFVIQPASLVSSHVVHNGWSGSGSNIDTTKSLFKEQSTPQPLSFDNLTNSSRGINGLQFGISSLANPGALSASDFVFQVSPQGAFDSLANPPTSWALATSPTVSVVSGATSTVSLAWPDNTIANRWLRVTLKSNANTGLASPEVYYVGHLLGETTGLSGSVYSVSFADISPIRFGVGTTVDAGSILDTDKNGTVAFGDITAMRGNVGTQLTNPTVQSSGGGGGNGPLRNNGSGSGVEPKKQGVLPQDLIFNHLVSSSQGIAVVSSSWFVDDRLKTLANRKFAGLDLDTGFPKVDLGQSGIVRTELFADSKTLSERDTWTAKTNDNTRIIGNAGVLEDATSSIDLFFEEFAEVN